MKNFCSNCGSKVDQEFKFCPDCGVELSSSSNSDKTPTVSKTEKLLVCENCGEDNSASNINCSSCGVKLKGSLIEKELTKIENSHRTKSGSRSNKKVTNERKNKSQEKTFDSKKILLLSTIVIAIIVVLLATTGVFDSGIDTIQQTTNGETENGVSLANINEITQLENILKSNPKDKSSIIKLANLLQDSGLFDRAILYYKKYLELDPTDANARVDLGICYYNLNDFQSAITEMETALKYQPKHQLAHLNLGIVNLTAGKVDISKAWFRKALEIDPNSKAGERAQELLQSH